MSQPLPNAEKIPIVADALHSVRRYAGKTVVIKYGGNAMADDSLQTAFARDLSLLKLVGVKPIIVHGGAPQINETLAKLNIDSRFVNGLRHTDDETMTVVEMVLGGAVNQNIVRLINRHGGNAVGLTGRDGGLIQAKRKMMADENGEPVDLGRVGTVTGVNPTSLVLLENAGFTPIIAPIGADEDGQSLNINADTVAAEVAIAPLGGGAFSAHQHGRRRRRERRVAAAVVGRGRRRIDRVWRHPRRHAPESGMRPSCGQSWRRLLPDYQRHRPPRAAAGTIHRRRRRHLH